MQPTTYGTRTLFLSDREAAEQLELQSETPIRKSLVIESTTRLVDTYFGTTCRDGAGLRPLTDCHFALDTVRAVTVTTQQRAYGFTGGFL